MNSRTFKKILKLLEDTAVIYLAVEGRRGLLTDAEFDALEANRAQIGRLLDSPKTNTNPELRERTATRTKPTRRNP